MFDLPNNDWDNFVTAEFEKGIATVNYGMFTTKAALEKLNKV